MIVIFSFSIFLYYSAFLSPLSILYMFSPSDFTVHTPFLFYLSQAAVNNIYYCVLETCYLSLWLYNVLCCMPSENSIFVILNIALVLFFTSLIAISPSLGVDNDFKLQMDKTKYILWLVLLGSWFQSWDGKCSKYCRKLLF